ncbi:hypothetical protein ALC53_10626 [Atta colombica]|uniref:Uncharacterized protein n=1 Tax=Atta colombica TaxID=520822 RepID=A0A195B486_9HYME|nr:hypothetical protein ALC53_10626 [Atta colombica]
MSYAAISIKVHSVESLHKSCFTCTLLSYCVIKFLKLPQERRQDNFIRRVRWVENLLAATESMSVKMCDIQ